jgi:hypothetical protein
MLEGRKSRMMARIEHAVCKVLLVVTFFHSFSFNFKKLLHSPPAEIIPPIDFGNISIVT